MVLTSIVDAFERSQKDDESNERLLLLLPAPLSFRSGCLVSNTTDAFTFIGISYIISLSCGCDCTATSRRALESRCPAVLSA